MADRVRQYTEELEAQVTERTAALVDALRRAEAATVAKSEFLANMSHEIRTPMTAIIGYTDILIEKSYGRDAQEPLAVIKRNGEHLLSIINDILDLSKIEAGKLEVERIRFSPLQMIAELGSLMRVRAEAKGLALQIEFDGEMPETVEGDPTRVRQILINLLGNAIKFTEFGTIRLAVALCRRERLAALAAQPDGSGPAMLPADSEFYLRFDVIDTGIGISPEQLATLFRPFQQADGSMTRRYGGTGLGLTISRHLTGMLGGTLLVDSAVGEGSRFRVILPVGDLAGVPRVDHPGVEAVRDSHPAARTVPRISGPCRVLLAEDGPDNQRLISYVLGKAGIEVTVAENGRIAVDHVREALGRGEKYDVILMDMQMPVLDGYGATGQLRSMGYPGPIIALTAHAMASDREKCLNAGCTDYLTKPINRQDLLDRIRAYCQTVSPADVEACCTASGGAT
jgi:Amt family ammonium transporter